MKTNPSEIVKTLGVAKYVICYISRKEEGTGELSCARRPGCGHMCSLRQPVPGGQSLEFGEDFTRKNMEGSPITGSLLENESKGVCDDRKCPKNWQHLKTTAVQNPGQNPVLGWNVYRFKSSGSHEFKQLMAALEERNRPLRVADSNPRIGQGLVCPQTKHIIPITLRRQQSAAQCS